MQNLPLQLDYVHYISAVDVKSPYLNLMLIDLKARQDVW